MRVLNKDFNEFISKLDKEQIDKLPNGYLDFCKSIMNELEKNPSVFFTADDHIGMRYEKYGELLNIEISDIDDINGSLTMHMLTLKSPEWSYEKEWRTFFLPKHNSNAEQMPTPCAVYLGSQMSKGDEIKVYQICAAQNIPVYKMMPDQRSHKLIPKPYIPPVI